MKSYECYKHYEYMKFGGDSSYWYVLRQYGEYEFLLLYADVIEKMPYNNNKEAVSWKDCSLRSWLNTTFLNSFSKLEQEQIVPVTNRTIDGDGYIETVDKVYLLSRREFFKYLNNTFYKEPDTPKWRNGRIKMVFHRCSWWLRSATGNTGTYANFMDSYNLSPTECDTENIAPRPVIRVKFTPEYQKIYNQQKSLKERELKRIQSKIYSYIYGEASKRDYQLLMYPSCTTDSMHCAGEHMGYLSAAHYVCEVDESKVSMKEIKNTLLGMTHDKKVVEILDKYGLN